ncbi:PEP-CTERM sorting domain-containing protein [Luteolibacter yonseiensis]|uniref:PEP-CTERM sorting domain-containing protein n=1 Tax=Luteolibacter yonseiensis TaxID=1144680 RepID=A0A934R6A9_9BACT|nr:PEP-CTERM sorting domain-containing protein [Luteolibacter yonseiensis]MBK1816040.1 PEP-CTERM sorting domain-containing protein [Luteolibacter yonseiensis]
MKFQHTVFHLIAASALMVTSARSAQTIVAYAEEAGRTTSTLSGTSVFDFNTLAPGRMKNVTWTGVGTFDQLHVKAADKWGGAGGSNYSVQSYASLPITTLTLMGNHSCFGFWWSGADTDNVITFYSGTTMVAQFTSGNLLEKVAAAPDYHGNPVDGPFRGMNNTQAYAFVNILGTGGTTWNRITFTNMSKSGFETDNYTDRVAPYGTYPGERLDLLPSNSMKFVNGVPVTSMMPAIPEPSALLLGGIGAFVLCSKRRRA